MHHQYTVGNRTALLTLYSIYFAVFAGYSLLRFILPNYSVETLDISAGQIGILTSLLAAPGVFAFCIGCVARKVKPSVLMELSCLFIGTGLMLIGLMPGWYYLICGVLLIGIGLAVFYPIITSFIIENAEFDKVSISLGQLKCLGPLAGLVSVLLIQISVKSFGYEALLILIGFSIILIGTVAALYVRKMSFVSDEGNLSFKFTLWPYYTLNFLAGCRSAFFKVFIFFILVKEHHLQIQQTAWIGMIGNLCLAASYFFFGKMAKRYDHRNLLTLIYVLVALLFLGFSAFKNIQRVLVILFWCDSFLFGVSVFTDSHIKNTSASRNYVGDVATGLTLFNTAGFLMAFVAGMVWDNRGSASAFGIGSILALVAALVSRRLR